MCFLSTALWHTSPEAASLWLNVFHLTSCLPQTWGGGGWLKNSLQVGNKFIVFNLLSPALYAKCTCDTRRHTSKCRSICQHSGSANVVLSVVIYFICYVRAVFYHIYWSESSVKKPHSLQIADTCLGPFNCGLLLTLIGSNWWNALFDCVCLLFVLIFVLRFICIE